MKLLDFTNILAYITLFAGMVTLVNSLLKRFSKDSGATENGTIFLEYSRSLFPVLLAVLLIRSFLFQPYRVPSESLEPTVMPNDFILVTQYDYGIKIPLWNKTIINISKPKRGDIVLFRWPVNPTKLQFVKRVLGEI